MTITPSPSLREDLLILLEPGPHDTKQLAAWLREPETVVLLELLAMGRRGLLRRVGADRRWALASQVEPLPPADSPPAVTTVGRASQQTEAVTAAPITRPAVSRPAVPPLEAEEDGLDIVDDTDGIDEDVDDIDRSEPPPPRRPGRKPKAGLRIDATKPAVQSGPAWWVGKTREEFSVEARRQYEERLQFKKKDGRR